MKECVEEGILQGYFDGELSPLMMKTVATHLASCARCAEEARAVERETEMLVAAFEPEMSLSVPTERLRARIGEAIANLEVQSYAEPERPAASRLGAWLSSLAASFSLAPRYAVGYASIIAVAAFALIFALIAMQQGRLQVARNNNSTIADLRLPQLENPGSSDTGGNNSRPTVKVTRQTKRFSTRKSVAPTAVSEQEVASVKPLPGERTYLQAIASLTSEIEAGGGTALKPALRAEYERNVAVLDHAIRASRETARRNPKNPDAAEFLYSSYQSKVELLGAVAEQSRLEPASH